MDFCSLRIEREVDEWVSVIRGVPRPPNLSRSFGAMVTIHDRGGLGYAATADLSREGLKRAIGQAKDWAHRSAGRAVTNFSEVRPESVQGKYETPVMEPWHAVPLEEKLDLLVRANEELNIDARILDWGATLWSTIRETLLITADGGRLEQRYHFLHPSLYASASDKGETQTRSLGSYEVRQGGLEVLDAVGWDGAAERVSREAIQLLEAENCPSGDMDIVIGGDQMVIQVHESIGHPLELDRILGDERNYAGTSFVTPDMIGTHRYGSELLNVTFDSDVEGEAASFAFDDAGTRAGREYLIKDGLLRSTLGGATSQARANLPGVATERACSWNRPPIDRMSNLNVEPGGSSLSELVAQVERGVYVDTCRSWSIDDSRNKFQFGCEWSQKIEEGELTDVVRNPNYRGVSWKFWHSLAGVGDQTTAFIGGTSYCGKGEPNQGIRVGHATVACLFRNVAVFGGA